LNDLYTVKLLLRPFPNPINTSSLYSSQITNYCAVKQIISTQFQSYWCSICPDRAVASRVGGVSYVR